MTSTEFEGGVVFKFRDTGELITFDMSDATLSGVQSQWLVSRCPAHLDRLKEVVGKSTTAKITELQRGEVTFELFWNKYDSKTHSSKKRTLAKWNKMTLGERVKAFSYINKYVAGLKQGVEKKYAETYLNAELWNN